MNRLVSIAMLTLLCPPTFARVADTGAGPAAEADLASAPFADCRVGVHFDGACRTASWIESNLSDGAEITDYGACSDDSCDLYYTTAEGSTSGSTANHTITTTQLVDEDCSGGMGCVGGKRLAVETVTSVEVNASTKTVTGQVEMYGGKVLRLGGSLITRARMGHTDFTIHGGSQQVEVYDADGTYLTGYGLWASTDSTTEAWCKNFVDGMVEVGADLAAVGVAAAVGGVIEFAVTEVAAATAITGIGFPAAVGVWIAGSAFAAGAAVTAGVAVRSGLKTLADEYEVNSICEDIEPTDVVDIDLPGTGEPGDDEFEDAEIIGCMQCDRWGIEVTEGSTGTWDEETGTMTITATYNEEEVCLEWSANTEGSDTNLDGWCD